MFLPLSHALSFTTVLSPTISAPDRHTQRAGFIFHFHFPMDPPLSPFVPSFPCRRSHHTGSPNVLEIRDSALSPPFFPCPSQGFVTCFSTFSPPQPTPGYQVPTIHTHPDYYFFFFACRLLFYTLKPVSNFTPPFTFPLPSLVNYPL